MIQRTVILPTRAMARILAEHHPDDRATPEAAALLLLRQRLFLPDDIAAGLETAMQLAGDAAHAGLYAAASDAPWARGLAYLRDLAAITVLLVGGMYAWNVVA